MFNKFTEKARRIVLLAREEAKRLGHDYLGTEHLLLGLLREGKGVGAIALRNLGVDFAQLRAKIEKNVGKGGGTLFMEQIPFTPRAKKVIELAVTEAKEMRDKWVEPEHILLSLIKEGEGVAAEVLLNLGKEAETTYNKVKKEIEAIKKTGKKAEVIKETPIKKASAKLIEIEQSLEKAIEDISEIRIILGKEEE